MLRKTFVIVLIALIVSACSSSRQTVSKSTELRSSELRSSDVKDSVVIEVHDTIAETKTITITKNEVGDTVFTSVVTDRTRASVRDRVRDKQESVVVKTDTVFVEHRDSVSTTTRTNGWASPVVLTLKWVFWMIIAIIALIVTIKLSRFIRIKN